MYELGYEIGLCFGILANKPHYKKREGLPPLDYPSTRAGDYASLAFFSPIILIFQIARFLPPVSHSVTHLPKQTYFSTTKQQVTKQCLNERTLKK